VSKLTSRRRRVVAIGYLVVIHAIAVAATTFSAFRIWVSANEKLRWQDLRSLKSASTLYLNTGNTLDANGKIRPGSRFQTDLGAGGFVATTVLFDRSVSDVVIRLPMSDHLWCFSRETDPAEGDHWSVLIDTIPPPPQDFARRPTEKFYADNNADGMPEQLIWLEPARAWYVISDDPWVLQSGGEGETSGPDQ
jgi:hypothetical protein